MPRRTTALYANEIEHALREHSRLSLRAEKHRNFADLFTDNKQLPLLYSHDWQVVYGRRGTGKTILLGKFADEINAGITTHRALAVSIAIQDCVVSPLGLDAPDKVRARGYFGVFAEMLAEKLVDRVDTLLHDRGIIQKLFDSSAVKIRQIEELLLEMLSLVQDGRPMPAYGKTPRLVRQTNREHSAGAAANVKGSVKVGMTRANLALDTSAELEARQQEDRQEQLLFESEVVPRYAEARTLLIKLLDALNIDRLYILIDEWSLLDQTGATCVQPEFAEILKRIFGGTPRIVVKIAANRYQTRLSNRGAGTNYRGLEINADIFEATNLDHALLSDEHLEIFFKRLLYSRLRFCNDELNIFATRPDDVPVDAFYESLFRDPEGLSILVRASGGVPRDFLRIFNAVAHHHEHNTEPLWKTSIIKEIVTEESITKGSEMDYQSEANQLISKSVRSLVASRQSRIFFVRNEDYHSLESALDELLEKRLVHEFPTNRLAPEIRSNTHAFVLDYGLYLDLVRYLIHDPVSSDPDLDRINTLEQAEALTLDVSGIERDYVVCDVCNQSFPKDARSYRLKGLCPECFEPVGK